MNKAYTIELSEDAENIRFTEYEKIMKKYLKDRAIAARDLINLDAEVNGGALVPVATVMGKKLYVRVDHHDPEVAKHELAKVRALVKDVVLGDD